jgi:septum formation protein
MLEALSERLVLASTSPRRAEILRAVGCKFETIAANVDESLHDGENAISYVRRLAALKAQTVSKMIGSGLVLGADTTVVVEGEILAQPTDDDDARRMLRLLEGKWHEVLTGVAVFDAAAGGTALIDHESTRVRFAPMNATEIDWYVSTGEPKGKAGAYGIQGKAALFIEEIEGDYFNVVGLPIRKVYKLLTSACQNHRR